MNNETTASQPKSIGDDAQFVALLDWCLEAHISGVSLNDRKRFDAGVEKMISYINSRAPAAQASATIQAAPELTHAVIRNLYTASMKKLVAELEDDNRVTAVGAPSGTLRRLSEDIHKFRFAEAVRDYLSATIQEPVMVAEPVGVSGLSAAVLQAMHKAFQRGDSVERAHAAVMGLVAAPMVAESDESQWVDRCSYDAQVDEWAIERSNLEAEIERLKSAAPMVADPAGVSRRATDAEVAAWAERYDIANMLGSQARSAFEDAESLHMTYAATVKAVPSEALCLRCALSGEVTKCGHRAASLADKTGGAK